MADRDYEVGYGKPPKHGQFPKGKSGFEGRKHKPKQSASDLLDAILDERVVVSEGGKSAKMTKREVFMRQLMAAALSGDRHARKLVLDYVYRRQFETAAQGDGTNDDYLIEELKNYLTSNRPEGARDGED